MKISVRVIKSVGTRRIQRAWFTGFPRSYWSGFAVQAFNKMLIVTRMP